MNSNLFHNILNVAIAMTAAATAFLVATGCVTNPAGGLDCAGSWVNPTYTSVAVAVMGLLKTGINIVRDGLGGLIKPQPPVK